MRIWKTGDAVELSFEGRTVSANVLLASRNGKSLALQFEAIIGGFVGMMPVLWNDEQQAFLDIVGNRRVVVRAVGGSDG
jgi:hypothetical protein